MTWGMPIAVFGMRLIFPIIIVAVAGHLTPASVFRLATHSSEEYIATLKTAQPVIDTFGGIFLLMVFLKFICDQEKEVHWLGWLEKKFKALGRFSSIEIVLALLILIIAQSFMLTDTAHNCLLAGMGSIMLHSALNSFEAVPSAVRNGLMRFIYLEVLDASCSFDGVFAAFVFTNNIILIMIGLGIGAFAIRSLTLHLVKGGQLKEYIYLEHGAHYGIGALAVIMLVDIFYSVPEPITGMIGLSFIGLSLVSSLKAK